MKDDTTANQVKNTLKKLGIIFICTKKDAVININTEGVQQGAKHRLRSRTQGHKWDILQWPGQPPDVSLELHNLQLLKTKVKAQIPTNKQQQQSLTIKYFHSNIRNTPHVTFIPLKFPDVYKNVFLIPKVNGIFLLNP